MLIVRFGVQVDMVTEAGADALFAPIFNAEIYDISFSPTKLVAFLDTGGELIILGTFDLTDQETFDKSPVTGFEVFGPDGSLLISLTGVAGLTIADADNETVFDMKMEAQIRAGFKALGSRFNDILLGDVGNDILEGGAGDDILDGAGGTDLLKGQAGNDLYKLGSAAELDPSLSDPGIDTVQIAISYTLGIQQENLLLAGGGNLDGAGNAGNNSLTGNAGSNTLSGEAGNDTLAGGKGVDLLSGGTGNDTYVIDRPGEIDKSAADPGIDNVKAEITYRLGEFQENLQLLTSQNLDGIGNSLSNIINGNAGDNHLAGRDGADVLLGDRGVDTLKGGKGADTLNGGNGNDLLLGGNGSDTLNGRGGDDELKGGRGADLLSGKKGDDLAYGGDGDDWISGGNGEDVLWGDIGADLLYGGEGNDLAYGGDGDDWISGGYGEDMLWGAMGADLLHGGEGNDVIRGGAGNDVLSGGAGVDTLDGEDGSDTYLMAQDEMETVELSIWPSDDGSIYLGGGVNNSSSLISTEGIRGVAEFPLDVAASSIQSAFLTLNPYALPLWGLPVEVYGYQSSDGVLTTSDYENGTFLGVMTFSEGTGFGVKSYFDVTEFVTLATEDYVGFNLRTSGTDDFSSLEINYGSPAELVIQYVPLDTVTDELHDSGTTPGDVDVLDTSLSLRAMLGDFSAAETGIEVIRGADSGTELLAHPAGVHWDLDDVTLIDIRLLSGSDAADVISATVDGDSIHGNGGDDDIDGRDGDDVLAGGAGNDVLWGGKGADQLYGGEGNDIIRGGAGNDLLHGGVGVDALDGEDGSDTYLMAQGDVVVDEVAIWPSDDGSIYSGGAVVNFQYLMPSGDIRGVVEFPLNIPAGSIQSVSLSVTPYGSPTWDSTVDVYGYQSSDGVLTFSDYDNGTFLGVMTVSELNGYGEESFFDVTEFVTLTTEGYVGFNLRTSGTDVLSSLEYNSGSPAELVIRYVSVDAKLDAPHDTGSTPGDVDVLDASLLSRALLGDFSASDTGIEVIRGAGTGTELLAHPAGVNWDFADVTMIDISALSGSDVADVIVGAASGDSIRGNGGDDEIDGGDGDDVVAGGVGNDLLAGGEGNDIFLFDDAFGAANVDTIMDFGGAGAFVLDLVQLDNAVFTALSDGALTDAEFESGTDDDADNAATRIIYNTTTGALFYDADGSAGGSSAIQFAVVATDVDGLSAADFVVI